MWAIIAIGSLVVLLSFLLWVPLDFSLNLDVYGKPEVKFRYSWGFGLLRRELPRRKKGPSPEEKPAPKRKKKRFRPLALYKIIRTRGLLKNLLRLVREVFACFRFWGLAADFRVGLGDPADTGMLFTVLGPAVALAGPYVFNRVNIQPSFEDGPSLEGFTYGSARLRPIRLVPPVMKFVFSRPAARFAWAMAKAKIKR